MSLMDFLEFELHLSFNRLNQHAEIFCFNCATTTILNNFNQNLLIPETTKNRVVLDIKTLVLFFCSDIALHSTAFI